eukprot:Rhum_TRINITY_DN15480_c1_g2::Rhum_TRINITY_DN15480_c1_g2_i1::g.158861::m.158861
MKVHTRRCTRVRTRGWCTTSAWCSRTCTTSRRRETLVIRKCVMTNVAPVAERAARAKLRGQLPHRGAVQAASAFRPQRLRQHGVCHRVQRGGRAPVPHAVLRQGHHRRRGARGARLRAVAVRLEDDPHLRAPHVPDLPGPRRTCLGRRAPLVDCLGGLQDVHTHRDGQAHQRKRHGLRRTRPHRRQGLVPLAFPRPQGTPCGAPRRRTRRPRSAAGRGGEGRSVAPPVQLRHELDRGGRRKGASAARERGRRHEACGVAGVAFRRRRRDQPVAVAPRAGRRRRLEAGAARAQHAAGAGAAAGVGGPGGGGGRRRDAGAAAAGDEVGAAGVAADGQLVDGRRVERRRRREAAGPPEAHVRRVDEGVGRGGPDMPGGPARAAACGAGHGRQHEAHAAGRRA